MQSRLPARLVFLLLLLAVSGAAQQIPPGTTLPLMLNSTLDSGKDQPGKRFTGKLMQDVLLPDGQVISRGANISGHIVSVQRASAGAPSQLTLMFDGLELKGKNIPISAHLRAVASPYEVYEAWMPTNAWDDFGTSPSDWNTVLIGGGGVYRGNGEVVQDGEIVGRATDYGAVTAKLIAAPKRGCSGTSAREQALWHFSPSACGSYGLHDLQIVRSEQGIAGGEILLESVTDIHIAGGSGWLLRVDAPPQSSDTTN